MITTLAWMVLDIVSAPPWRASRAYRPLGRTRTGSFAMQDLWPPAELCKIRNPQSHSLPPRAVSLSGERAIMFRETLFRGMDFPPGFLARRGVRFSARAPRRHRPPYPERAAGRRPHHQCRAGAPGRHFGAALPAPCARAGGGRLHQRLSRAARREEARLRGHRVRHGASGEPGGRRSHSLREIRARASRWCANAGCCRAKSTSS